MSESSKEPSKDEITSVHPNKQKQAQLKNHPPTNSCGKASSHSTLIYRRYVQANAYSELRGIGQENNLRSMERKLLPRT